MEPSPASTYGDTVGSSVPATPLDTNSHDLSAGITQSMRAVQLDPAIKSISASPISPRESKHQGVHVPFGFPHTTPSKKSDTVVNQTLSSNSSPTKRAEAIRSAPTWRGDQQSDYMKLAHDHPDDPFVAGSSSQQPSESTARLACHPDKLGVTPTNNTAQAIFSPQACVFVANLTQSESDEQLEYAVTEAFQRFGNVYVKIRRDARQMPFAFAQYTTVEDAQQAITLGRGMLINGRPCRTEVARVNRSLYLSKINGATVSEIEAKNIMEGYGPVELVWLATQTEREVFGLPEGIFIRFAFFDDCRDALVSFRDSSIYRLEQVKGLEESRSSPADGAHRSIASPYRRELVPRMSPAFTRRHADARSIFIGNLAPHLSEDQLLGMFQIYGRVSHVEIIRKPSMVNASGVNAFAFIEYDNAQSAALAVQAGSLAYQGLQLRVEHKEPYNSPLRSSPSFSGSPRRPGLLDSQDMIIAFQRGVSMGMSQATQAQLMPPPFYPQYQYCAPYSNSSSHSTMPPSTNDAATAGTQVFTAGYMGPVSGQYSYTGAPAPYEQYQQHHQHQQYYAPNVPISQLQYPSAAGYEDVAIANPASLHENH
ncbi:uncharacterized protein KY384_001090 [Bacidia gigantensis]|uniref:uncharacterized protein n=1 Tax=Bacidia gigantensis TaxID=2732470 RepID=UPI001D050DFB|nr:uncharacterized protein KY384_001090 [Bacidia gigantensis]KAG8534246.1 hypothetical protein KY384_001090 [Bacidia gigantensis]